MKMPNLLGLGLLSVLCFLTTYATAQKSVTIVTHGFQIQGSTLEDLSDFYTFVRGIKTRVGANTAIYTNDRTLSGGWFKLSDLPNIGQPADCQITNPATANIILLYNWTTYSNDLAEGSLEAAADQLFGVLAHPHGLTYGGNVPINVNFLTNPNVHKHFISHSRGSVLVMQVLRRINQYFPNTQIDHWTTLDPHPAEGNLINDTNLWGIAPDVNYNYKLRLPANEAQLPIVKKVDNYFRKAATYQPLLGNYSGVFVEGTPSNFELNEAALSTGCYSSRAHSNVHAWYYGTISRSALMTYGTCNNEYFPLTWYPPGWRLSHGYNKSFLGGGYSNDFNDATGTKTSILDVGKPALGSVFNGNFQYGSVGWESSSNYASVSNGYVVLNAQQKMVHCKMYFPSNRKYLKLKAKSILPNWSVNIAFFEYNNNVLITEKKTVYSGEWQTLYIPIPAQLLGKVGGFKMATEEGNNLTSLYVDDIELIDCPPNCECDDVPPIAQPTNPEYGVTLLVHGFSGTGIIDASWTTYANGIADRALNATIYKNDAATGAWYPIGVRGNGNGEIILVYDWADLSNNGLLSDNPSTGFLQSAADYLYASLIDPPTAHLRLKGVNLLGKKMHFIGHSRGCIVLLQVLHRMLANHGTDVKVNQLTLLDPHPATTFGDVETEQGIYKSLPGVTGVATGCSLTIGCSNGSNISIKIPNNVEHADHYYRTDELFEGVTDFGSFDGVSVAGLGNYSRKLNENIINTPMCMSGASDGQSHSKVHAWYYGTIKPVGTIPYNDCTINDQTPANWYDCLVYDNLSNMPSSRTRTGYYHSRLGGGTLPPAPTVTTNLAEMNSALSARGEADVIKPVFNGDFKYGAAGWERNNRFDNVTYNLTTFPYFMNGHALLGIDNTGRTTVPQNAITHSLLFFGKEVGTNKNYRYVRMSVKDIYLVGAPKVKVSFIDWAGTVQSSEQVDVTGNNGVIMLYFAIPSILYNKTGTFKIENITGLGIEIDDVDLATCKPACDCTNEPYVVTQFTAGRTSNNVVLNWNDNLNTSNIVQYVVEQSIGSHSNWRILDTLDGGTRSYGAGRLGSNTFAYYRIKALTGCLFSAYQYSGQIANYTYSVNKQVTQLEYFIDSDPGFGNGTSLSVSAGQVMNPLVDIATNALSEGIHVLHIRAKDDQNYWSLPFIYPFVKPTSNGGALAIDRVEYFIDTDPGLGAGATVVINQLTDLVQPTVDFKVPLQSVSNGIHILHVRARDTRGKWSNVHSQAFARFEGLGDGTNQVIQKLEYFIDTDPGLGSGTSVAIDRQERVSIQQFKVDLSNISNGIHILHVRAQDNAGNWSQVHHQTFARFEGVGAGNDRVIEKIEYFIDTEPGLGNGIDIAVSRQATVLDQQFNIDLNNVANGVHTLYVRVRDNAGNWSNIHQQIFLQMQGNGLGNAIIQQMECFVDEDPGLGQAMNIPLTPAAQVEPTFNVNLSQVNNGVHALHVRAKDNYGKWSSISVHPFVKLSGNNGNPVITRVEYFWDTDPGFGNATTMSFTGTTAGMVQQSISLASVSSGRHRFYVRAKDAHERWSTVFNDTVYVNPTWIRVNLSVASQNTSCGLSNGSVQITAASGTAPYEYALNNGAFQSSNTFNSLASGNYVVKIRDRDGYLGEQTVTIQASAPSPNAVISGNTTICEDGSTILTASGGSTYQWSNGQTTPAITANQAASYTVTVTDGNGCTNTQTVQILMVLKPTANFTFATNSLHVSFTNRSVGGTTFLWNFGNGITSTESNPTIAYTTTGTYLVSLTVTNHCGSRTYQQTVVTTTVLPIDLLLLTAVADGESNRIEWSTTSEKNTQWHFIERSATGNSIWDIVEKVAAQGNSTQRYDYQLFDNQPLVLTYYRLRSMDADGKGSLSKIVSVNRRPSREVSMIVYPIPARNILHISFSSIQSEMVTFDIVDMMGRVLSTANIHAAEGENQMTLPIESLASGFYLLHLKMNGSIQTSHFVKK